MRKYLITYNIQWNPCVRELTRKLMLTPGEGGCNPFGESILPPITLPNP